MKRMNFLSITVTSASLTSSTSSTSSDYVILMQTLLLRILVHLLQPTRTFSSEHHKPFSSEPPNNVLETSSKFESSSQFSLRTSELPDDGFFSGTHHRYFSMRARRSQALGLSCARQRLTVPSILVTCSVCLSLIWTNRAKVIHQ